MKAFLKLTATVALLSLAACASDSQRPADDSAATTAPATTPAPAPTAGSVAAEVNAAMPNIRVIYFALDSSEINSEGRNLADGWAAYLAANPNARVRLEGHCDERGTREYNVGLGERRANAVMQALTSRGASARQISVTSYGEERPVASGHDESAWQQNRRVEIVM